MSGKLFDTKVNKHAGEKRETGLFKIMSKRERDRISPHRKRERGEDKVHRRIRRDEFTWGELDG